MSADAYHLTATHPEGKGAILGMKWALEDAGVSPEEVDYLNPHATSTPMGDVSEMKAVTGFFGKSATHLHISATKSATGHMLGAAGAVEALICIKTIDEGVIPPTINSKKLDPEMPPGLNVVLGKSYEKEVKVALSNTFGFGGHNASAVFRKL
jgi:3-oxoacyl-[acyl-carrier-protein] synthase II